MRSGARRTGSCGSAMTRSRPIFCSREFREHVVAAGDRDQFRDPADRTDHRLVPFLEVDAWAPRPGRCGRSHFAMALLAGCNPRFGPVAGTDHRCNQSHGRHDLVDAALVRDEDIEPCADQLVRQFGLHVGETDHEIRLQIDDAVDAAIEERADPRLLLARLRRTHRVAADADDAVLFTEEVQPLGRFLGQADDSLRSHLPIVRLSGFAGMKGVLMSDCFTRGLDSAVRLTQILVSSWVIRLAWFLLKPRQAPGAP